MSGNLTVQQAAIEPNIHTHLVLGLNDGRRLFFEDQRKFGRVMLLDPAGLTELDARFGPEPLAACFTPDELCRRLANRRTKIKPLLLDQQVVAGLGNIYVSEALWQARIHPARLAADINMEACRHLHRAIVSVLTRAIANQGSTLRNYRNSYGENGRNQEHFSVYARTGEPCERCATPISRTVIAQRSSFFCAQCQT
jgi:formamidopyrimidine-DNA glycosylase